MDTEVETINLKSKECRQPRKQREVKVNSSLEPACLLLGLLRLLIEQFVALENRNPDPRPVSALLIPCMSSHLESGRLSCP